MNLRLFASLSILTVFSIASQQAHASNAELESYIARYNPNHAHEITLAIEDAADTYSIDPRFLAAIIRIESAFHQSTISSAGAIGLSQLMPGTADGLGVNAYDYYDNVQGGAKYLREMLDLHANKGVYQYNYALASYNAGPGNVGAQIPSYTYEYINSVQNAYQEIKRSVSNATRGSTVNYSLEKKELQLLALYKLKEIKKLNERRHSYAKR